MKVACLTVIYPGVEDFIEEYIESIERQTFKDFDLIIINNKFPQPVERILKNGDVKTEIFACNQSPQANRLQGLKICRRLGYDIVVCSDADDIMFDDRIEKIIEYFIRNKGKKLVYNNLVNNNFDLFYKDCITLHDILEFNVLGYGASSIRSELIPFILEHSNESVPIFDWWFALVYLLRFKEVSFLKNVKSYYRMHPGNYVGPIFNITEDGLKRSLYVKKVIYSELVKYCRENAFLEEKIFVEKCKEMDDVDSFINKYSFSAYYERVKAYFSDVPKMFWWQDAVSLNKCGGIRL